MDGRVLQAISGIDEMHSLENYWDPILTQAIVNSIDRGRGSY